MRPTSRQDIPVELTDPAVGLTASQAQLRLDGGWGNQIHHHARRSEWDIIRQNCLTFFNLVFVVMAVAMLLVGASVLNLTFMVIVIVNTCIGCVQEIRAKRAVDKLTLVAARKVQVLRDGVWVEIPHHLLVRDDIIALHPGDQICADGVVCHGELQVNEALITGEADAIDKNEADLLRSGSFVVAGKALVRLTQVGDDAFAAKLATEAKKDPNVAKSEMMGSLDRLIHIIGYCLIPVAALLLVTQLYRQNFQLQPVVSSTVANLVGLIPEGLYLLTSIALALASITLTRRRVLVQDMNCIETLAQVDVLCVDKTGTITEPSMKLAEIIPLNDADPDFLEQLLTALYGIREPENDTGKTLYDRFRGECPWLLQAHIPFTSQTKWSSSAFADVGAFVTGAPEFVMGDRYDTIEKTVERYSSQGYRVLLVARYEGVLEKDLHCDLLSPLALLALTNPIRENAPATFAYFQQQKVTVKVISGDHPATAAQVAGKAGIPNAERYVDATTLKTPGDFLTAAEEYTVFGRVTPDAKRQLIRAMKENGHTVAMTGDGVNDVLALKDADCGISMASGAQAASQVARLVLLDSDFSAMPAIVDEGRRVINNIQRASALFLVKNIFALGLMLMTVIGGLQSFLEPFHLSIVSSLTIGVPGFFLALEPNYQRVRGQFLRNTLRRALPGGITDILVVLAAQILMAVFHLPATDGATVTVAVLCAVGLTVLFRVCYPFSRLRRIIWLGSVILVVGAFIVLPPITGYLAITAKGTYLFLAAVILIAPTVFFGVSKIYHRLDPYQH